AHALGQENLAQAIVDLVAAGMVQLFALEIDLCATQMLGGALGEIERAGAADIMGRQILEFGAIGGIGLGGAIFLFEVQDQRHQRFSDEAAAINAEAAMLVRAVAQGIGLLDAQGNRPPTKSKEDLIPACRWTRSGES